MTASQTTMDKLYGMRMSVMAQAYRDQEESQGVAEMTFSFLLTFSSTLGLTSRETTEATALLLW